MTKLEILQEFFDTLDGTCSYEGWPETREESLFSAWRTAKAKLSQLEAAKEETIPVSKELVEAAKNVYYDRNYDGGWMEILKEQLEKSGAL